MPCLPQGFANYLSSLAPSIDSSLSSFFPGIQGLKLAAAAGIARVTPHHPLHMFPLEQ